MGITGFVATLNSTGRSSMRFSFRSEADSRKHNLKDVNKKGGCFLGFHPPYIILVNEN